MSEHILRGVPAAGGIALGTALVYRPEAPVARAERSAGSPEQERARFEAAVIQAEQQLDALSAKADHEGQEILQAHKLMLQDPELRSLVEGAVAEGKSADVAVNGSIEQFADMLESLGDEYLRERAADVRDVGRRLLAALSGRTVGLTLDRPAVVVARDLAPTDTLGLDRAFLLALVTEHGGPTSHTSILARSWGVPAVVATAGVLEAAAEGMLIAVDGSTGEVVLEPGPVTRDLYKGKLAEAEAQAERDRAEKDLPAQTPDGYRVELAANAGSPQEVALAMEKGAEGVGLLRSEFLFMGHESAPDEEEQFKAYAEALQHAHGHRVIIRTLDIGGDKDVPYLNIPKEENPFLGVRALRLCFRRPELFRTQLRALLRASVHGKLAIMFPMVAGLEDLRKAKAALDEAKQSLMAEGHTSFGQYEVGIMIEIPSAALVARHLAKEVDFFSVGTNDLTQYTLAVDRGNPDLADMYEPYHPSILNLFDMVIKAGHAEGKWVGVCGELGGMPAGALLLLGLGIDELSMSPSLLARIRRLVRGTPFTEAQAVAQQSLTAGTPAEVLALVEPLLKKG